MKEKDDDDDEEEEEEEKEDGCSKVNTMSGFKKFNSGEFC